jgi:hypothetical protein
MGIKIQENTGYRFKYIQSYFEGKNMVDYMKERMGQAQKTMQTSGGDLNAILRSTEAQTQTELASSAKRTEVLQQYMELNQSLSKQINEYLTKSQSLSEKFQTLLSNPKNKSSWGRFFSGLPIIGGKVQQKLSPQHVAEVLKDLYTNLILQKDSVAKQVRIIESRREELFVKSDETANSLDALSQQVLDANSTVTQYKTQRDLADQILTNNGQINELDISVLSAYYQKLGVSANTKPTLINIAKLTEVVDELDKLYSDADEKKLKFETELNSANSAVKGYRIQKQQFNGYVKSSKVLLFGLETHLKYSKELMENQAILAQAQDTTFKAVEAFAQYHDAMNKTLVLNSLGMQIMFQDVAKILSTETFDEPYLKEAKDKADSADKYWDTFRVQYSNKAEALANQIQKATIESEK